MKRLSGLLQFMLGFVMGVAILVGGATAVAYMLLSGMNSNPPKPVFTEEKKEETKEEKTAVKSHIRGLSSAGDMAKRFKSALSTYQ